MAVIYVPEYYVAEREFAYYAARLAKQSVQKIEPDVEGLEGEQIDAVKSACENGLSFITGAAGTGKTTTLNKVLDSFQKAGMVGYVCTPTGKASKRADQVVNGTRTKVVDCSTTNSFLQFNPRTGKYSLNRNEKIDADYLVLDESTMQGILTSRDFMEAVDHTRTRVILSGDKYQLASVDPGAMFRDVVESQVVKGTMLTKPHRASLSSGITVNANRILRGESITIKKEDGTKFDDFVMAIEPDEAKARETILKWITTDLKERRGFEMKDIQIMTPAKVGLCGRKELNKLIRDRVNPVSSGKTVGGYRVGDQVMHLKNIRGDNLVNGDCGIVVDIVHGQNGSHMVIDFGPRTGKARDGICEFGPNMLERLQLNYAATIHKMQGSEQKCCIIPVYSSHYRSWTRALTYTGETRARMLHIFIGDPVMLRTAISNTREYKRFTHLQKFLKEEMRKTAA